MFSSPLQRAIKRGMRPGANLVDELRDLSDYAIRSKSDARAICDALRTERSEQSRSPEHYPSRLHALISLFQNVASRAVPAFDVLSAEGLPQLFLIFDSKLQSQDPEDVSDLLFVLKILAMYGTRSGAERIVQAAKFPLDLGASMWHAVLAAFSRDHPHRDYVYRALSDPLPRGFLAVALLDSANDAAIHGALQRHPYDSQAGWRQLQEWLEVTRPDHESYALSAAAALPFINQPARDQLLALALEHVDRRVQLEAAWVASKLGRDSGLKSLVTFCLDVNYSCTAQRYLDELDRADLIPSEVREASFQARAKFAEWLAHPNELGRPPDELEIVDHRQLAWPPESHLRPFWLMRYRLNDRTGLDDDDVGCGVVGSTTWCFYSYEMQQRPLEDVYAFHACWEMECANLIHENEVLDSAEYAPLLRQWSGPAPDAATIARIAEISPKLQTSARIVAVAIATLERQDGWLVLDGPRTEWYPKSEQPDGTDEKVVLKIHVGRQLLGFKGQSKRNDYLVPSTPRRSPQQFVATYERLLREVSEAAPSRQVELVGNYGLLALDFEKYINALVESGSN
ncbi:MAG: hypothetical protein MPJ50_11345, partial [Pirellulales bacterium]|nr:hypothetical protein [Pirellulales bacterium]